MFQIGLTKTFVLWYDRNNKEMVMEIAMLMLILVMLLDVSKTSEIDARLNALEEKIDRIIKVTVDYSE